MTKLSDLARGQSRNSATLSSSTPSAGRSGFGLLSKGRGKMRSQGWRWRHALADATQEHDGAYRDPMAMEMIAARYKVDLADLTKAANKVVAERDECRERSFQEAMAEAIANCDAHAIISIAIERGVDPDELAKAVEEHRQTEQASATRPV